MSNRSRLRSRTHATGICWRARQEISAGERQAARAFLLTSRLSHPARDVLVVIGIAIQSSAKLAIAISGRFVEIVNHTANKSP